MYYVHAHAFLNKLANLHIAKTFVFALVQKPNLQQHSTVHPRTMCCASFSRAAVSPGETLTWEVFRMTTFIGGLRPSVTVTFSATYTITDSTVSVPATTDSTVSLPATTDSTVSLPATTDSTVVTLHSELSGPC